MRRLTTFLPVPGDPAALRDVFRQGPQRWLPDAREVDAADGRWTMTVTGAGLSRTVSVEVGSPWSSSNTLWRSISWAPSREPVAEEVPPRLLPTFDGELGLITAGDDASLVLEGGYLPPGGAFGAALDGLALHRIARGTVDRLVAEVAARLAEQASVAPTKDR